MDSGEVDDGQKSEQVTKSTSVSGVVSFLRSHGIPERFCEAFEGRYSVHVTK